jgi:alcohol dehydrogenase class IV
VLLVTGRESARHSWLLDALLERKVPFVRFSIPSEPTTADAREIVRVGREHRVDVVVGVGGGSALDLAKVAAGLLGSGGDPLDYLEVIGAGRPLTGALPCLALPTTAGTGSEVTRNAVLDVREHGVKVSLRSEHLLPRVALVDPELTLTLPPHITASTGFDALVQVIEPFLSCAANPLTDALCREGIQRGARALVHAYRDGTDRAARTDLALTSLFGGLALANAKLGAVHGFAGPLGGLLRAPHGALCAALLPHVLRVNLRALNRRASESAARGRLDELGVLLTGQARARAEDAIAWCSATSAALSIPTLSVLGLRRDQITNAAQKSEQSSSMKGNPLALTNEELIEILECAL